MAPQVTIEVFGEEFTFDTQASPERAEKVADCVTRHVKMVEDGLAGAQGSMRKDAALVMAAMGIAHEFMELKAEHEAFLARMKERSGQLLRRAEQSSESRGV